MIISIASGKGGTGKTTVAVSLALAGENIHFLDCDVEEPNSAFFLKPEIYSSEEFSLLFPKVDKSICSFCGICAEVCGYKAIKVFKHSSSSGEILVLPHLCHSCGACAHFCPTGAITEIPKRIGLIESGKAKKMLYTAGRLDIGEISTPALIKAVKKKAELSKTVIIDCPPGASCPMTTAVKGSNFCVLVTEPTPFGLNDLEIAVEAVRKMEIPFAAIINRWDENYEFEKSLEERGIVVIGKIPFDRKIAEAYSMGIPAAQISANYLRFFSEILEKITNLLKGI